MWYKEIGKDSEYVISTRVRIARNLKDFNFPGNMSNDDMRKLNSIVESKIDKSKYNFLRLKDMDKITINSLIEQHLISSECAANPHSSLIINKDSSLVVMVNEEDHLRIQAFASGFNIDDVYKEAKNAESNLRLEYATNKNYGFLTSCPTNLGSGMRVSVMMHLPGLTRLKKINNIIENVLAAGILVRGAYGENTASYGDMYQFSNRSSFGESDEIIISNLKNVIAYVISQESKARKLLLKADKQFEDMIFRAYGTLKYSRYISNKEAIELLSKLRLGVSLKLIKDIDLKKVNALMTETSKSVLKILLKQNLDIDEENIERARYLRKELM